MWEVHDRTSRIECSPEKEGWRVGYMNLCNNPCKRACCTPLPSLAQVTPTHVSLCHLTQNGHGCTPHITTMQNLLQGNNACPRHNKFMHVCECVCVKESVRTDSVRISIKHTTHIAMGCWHPSGLHERSARAVHPMEGS